MKKSQTSYAENSKKHYKIFGGLIRRLTQELIDSNPKRYVHLDVSRLTITTL